MRNKPETIEVKNIIGMSFNTELWNDWLSTMVVFMFNSILTAMPSAETFIIKFIDDWEFRVRKEFLINLKALSDANKLDVHWMSYCRIFLKQLDDISFRIAENLGIGDDKKIAKIQPKIITMDSIRKEREKGH
jgi:hypothetical protein